jgi:hypothetical protein
MKEFVMRKSLFATALLAGVLAGCATAQGRDHGAMSHEDMMRHCEMMEQHDAEGGRDSSNHAAAQHGGMSHEEMMQHCAEIRGQGDHTPHQQ